MQILHATSEVYPFSKTGGLADVASALPIEQARQGAQVYVISPWYSNLGGQAEPQRVGTVQVPGLSENVEVGRIEADGVTYLFIEMSFFKRDKLYGSDDDIYRFVQFCKAIPEVVTCLGLQPHIIHAHDWAMGLLPVLLRHTLMPPALHYTRTVYTIHNLQYQGRWNPWEVLSWTGLPASLLHPDGLEFHGDLNMMKGGIAYSDIVTTVSPSYAHEITTPAYGEGLEGLLQRTEHQGRLKGIINGLDQDRWDPRTDPYAGFSDWAGKNVAREALRREFNLDQRPILGMVTRFAQQKGIDLVLEALPQILQDWNLVILGSGDTITENIFSVLSEHAPNVAYTGGYNDGLSHRIYAGSDAFLMPSRFEPCGLSQMIAMRYGTLPIVRSTGGLRDTVAQDIGFPFGQASASAMMVAIDRALTVWQHNKDWQVRVNRAMQLDWSWQEPARQYLQLYHQIAHH